MRYDGLHRHFERFAYLVFVKAQSGFFFQFFFRQRGFYRLFAHIGNDFTVFDFNYAVGIVGNFGIVGYQYNGVALCIQVLQNAHHHHP